MGLGKTIITLSHPSRVRGLKYVQHLVGKRQLLVAPLAGAWIEIL